MAGQAPEMGSRCASRVVGLLVDRTGFPLEIACFEGNKAETQT